MPTRLSVVLFLLGLWLVPARPAPAQDKSPDAALLRLVPDDYGIVFAVHDLRGQFEHWERSAWMTKLRAAPFVQQLLKSDEFTNLLKLKNDLETALKIDWPTLRDDVLGDALVFAFKPPADGKAEEGAFLLQARKPKVLQAVLDRINQLQMDAKELKALDKRMHLGTEYYQRVHDKTTHYYFVRDGLLVLTGSEAALCEAIAKAKRPAAENRWSRLSARAAGPNSLLSVFVNPRAFDAEFAAKPAAADFVKEKLGQYWHALDDVALNLTWREELELRLTLTRRAKADPAVAAQLFGPGAVNPLWSHFPDKAILTVAGEIDFSLDGLGGFLPPAQRKELIEGINLTLGRTLGLDVEKDLLPNVGPSWGLCVFPSDDDKNVPQAVLALAVRPGDKGADKALLGALDFLAKVEIWQHNRKTEKPIRLDSLLQDKLEVKVASCDKFPPGFQPAYALKDGYLLLATSPEGIARFRHVKAALKDGEQVFVKLSATELARQLRRHKSALADSIAERNGVPRVAAEHIVGGIVSIFDLFDSLEISRRRPADDHVEFVIRIRP